MAYFANNFENNNSKYHCSMIRYRDRDTEQVQKGLNFENLIESEIQSNMRNMAYNQYQDELYIYQHRMWYSTNNYL